MNTENIKFRVKDIFKDDAGKGIAKISSKFFNKLNFNPGDFIKLRNSTNNKIAGLRIYPIKRREDKEKIIRIDGSIRKSLSVRIGDSVNIMKIEPKLAKKLKLFDQDIGVPLKNSKIKEFLTDRITCKGNFIRFYSWTQKYEYKVIEVYPKAEILKINENTEIEVIKPTKRTSICREKIGSESKIKTEGINIKKMEQIFENIIKGDKLIKSDPQQAIHYYEKASEFYDLNTMNSDILCRLAHASINLGDKKKIKKDFQEAINYYYKALNSLNRQRGVIEENLKVLKDLLNDDDYFKIKKDQKS